MDRRQLIIELAMPVAFVLIAAAVIRTASGYGSEGIFPIMAAVILLICSVYLAAETLIRQKVVVELKGVNLSMVGITMVMLVCYALLLKTIGYVADTFLLCAFVIRTLGYRKLRIIFVCSALTVACTFFVFKVLLSVPLPVVLLDF